MSVAISTISPLMEEAVKRRKTMIYLPETRTDLKFCHELEELEVGDCFINVWFEFDHKVHVEYDDVENGLGHREYNELEVTRIRIAKLQVSMSESEEYED